ncbi:hypothetical protein STENM327S_06652 [Streptomyces tendae]
MNSAPADLASTPQCRTPFASKPRDSRAIRMRRISSAITSPYRIMNEAICTSSGGSLSRWRPRSSSRSSVVEARSTEAATPRVPLARTFQAPHRPLTLRDRPSTPTRSPSATNGMSTANATNGTSIRSRLSRKDAGTRAAYATVASSSAYRPKAHIASRGVDTTTTTKAKVAASLVCGGRPCTGEWPCR